MIRIAYVDDNMAESENIKNLIKLFIDLRGGERKGVAGKGVENKIAEKKVAENKVGERKVAERKDDENIVVEYFADAMDFLSNYKYCFDLIFIDPKTSNGNGYRIIDELRKIDPDVILIFVSETVEFAIYGYSVGAVDYILKSANVSEVNNCMERALKKVLSNNNAFINLVRDGTVIKVPISKILYIEKFEHTLIYHTEFGKFKKKQSLKDVEEQFEELGFLKCNRGMMVNSHFIQNFNKREVCLGDEVVPISRGQYEEFANEWQKRFEANFFSKKAN